MRVAKDSVVAVKWLAEMPAEVEEFLTTYSELKRSNIYRKGESYQDLAYRLGRMDIVSELIGFKKQKFEFED